MATDPYAALGRHLTAYEAGRLAAALQAGDSITRALKEIHPNRRAEVRNLLAAADLGDHRVDLSVAVLQGIAGARSVRTGVTPVWTMPGSQATAGRLTAEAQRLIDDARMSIVCSSFNFTPHSRMWTALRSASSRADVSVTVYLDAQAGSAPAVAAQMPKATVYQTRTPSGAASPLVSHAKFIILDRTLTLLTSANFSYSAEHNNVELGILVHDTALASSIEALMRDQHGILYERVIAKTT